MREPNKIRQKRKRRGLVTDWFNMLEEIGCLCTCSRSPKRDCPNTLARALADRLDLLSKRGLLDELVEQHYRDILRS